MTVGNLAMAMMVKHFIKAGHQAILLVGGATGLIGDPDGKTKERQLKSINEVVNNKTAIAEQYKSVFSKQDFQIVDNYDWFKDIGYLDFLRSVGKNVPMRQMLSREFVQTRLQEEGDGISYAEFSYSLIQGYDFLHLYRQHAVSLQVCGSDQWGNSIAGVELIRRIDGGEANIWSAPLVINKLTGIKFGKSETGTIWLDATKTSALEFYQFWINTDDQNVEYYLKIYTELSPLELDKVMTEHQVLPQKRIAQTMLAREVTKLIHGKSVMKLAETITMFLIGQKILNEASTSELEIIRANMASLKVNDKDSIIDALVEVNLASSKSDARRLISTKGITINDQKIDHMSFKSTDFQNNRLFIRRGKAYKDTALIELK